MENNHPREGVESKKGSENWENFIREITIGTKARERIGPAWPLLFQIALNADEAGSYGTKYLTLSRELGIPLVTLKKWRSQLCQHAVIESYSRGHGVMFRLCEPYRSFMQTRSLKKGNEVAVAIENLIQILKKETIGR